MTVEEQKPVRKIIPEKGKIQVGQATYLPQVKSISLRANRRLNN